ncbi:uncharacterized protein LOC126894536 isoform X2 [Daktulosphaira vitifoliae]|uniref:uncharacterized protein LOC126894536 isoform X2 n=1 Tax=Daktulosphaira vitifoliae TaxID=58002 RepID=UPI0021AA149B|nr:uncharacterized protein LOC126894536 isoform X2 [Daktulosphaira vitifoliae]
MLHAIEINLQYASNDIDFFLNVAAVSTMQSLPAANEEDARILLHLGRSYLHNKSLECSEDEEEEEEESENKEEGEEEDIRDKVKTGTEKLKQKNLLQKLYLSHSQKLCAFADSLHWPENQLSPSSLLDTLFDKPSEEQLNVLIITLFSVDIGFSIKMSIDINDKPIETYFNYEEDSILDYVKNEELPPHLLDIIEKANPSLFYCGCIIAEIQDKKCEEVKVYRSLLRPSNLSVMNDVNQLLIQNKTDNWSYEKKLKLESLLILASHPELCMDSSPSTGLAVKMQLNTSGSKIYELNPLKINRTPNNLGVSNSIRNTYHKFSELLYKKEKSSLMKIINCDESIGAIYYLMWEFDFRQESIKIINLSVLLLKNTQEYSILLKMNSIVHAVLRFKINLKTNNLKSYIDTILLVLNQKIDSKVSLVRTFKSGIEPRFVKLSCNLYNDNLYEPNQRDISELLDNLLNNKSKLVQNNSPSETENSFLNLSIGSSEIKLNSIKCNNSLVRKSAWLMDNQYLDGSMKSEPHKLYVKRKKNIHFYSTDKLTDNSNQYYKDISLFNHENNLVNGIKPKVIPNKKEPESPPLSPLAVNTSTSSLITFVAPEFVPHPRISSTSNEEVSIYTDQTVKNNKLVEKTEINTIDSLGASVSSSSNEVLSISISDLSSVTNSVSNPATVVSSSFSKVSSSEAISINSLLASQNLTLQTDRKLLSAFRGQRVCINTKLKSVRSTKNQHLKLLLANCDAAKSNSSIIKQPPNLNDVMKTATGTLLTQSFSTQYVVRPGVINSTHKNGINSSGQTVYKKIIYGNPVNNVNMSKPQIATLQRTSVDQSSTNCQLDRRKTKIISSLLNNKDMVNQPNIQVSLPGVIVPLNTASLSQFNNHHQVNIAPKSTSSSVSSFACQTLNNIKPSILGSISTSNNTIK